MKVLRRSKQVLAAGAVVNKGRREALAAGVVSLQPRVAAGLGSLMRCLAAPGVTVQIARGVTRMRVRRAG